MTEITNKLLLRQIKKRIGSIENVPDEVKDLLVAVDQSYDHYERDRRLLERAMEISSLELREQYEELTKKAELERSNEELEQFAYMASHDLKEPLRTIGGLSQVISRKLKNQLDEDVKEMFGLIIGGVKQMDLLLNDLLNYATIGNDFEEQTKIDLNGIFDVVKSSLSAKIEEQNVKITSSHLPVVSGTRTHMIQLFQNLIGNAIKFSSDKRQSEIEVKSEEAGDCYQFSIRDNGIGIAPEYQDKVFTVFHRLSKSKEGTGIGLSICKKIITHYKGQIWLESQQNLGTTFFFSLPRLKPELCNSKSITC